MTLRMVSRRSKVATPILFRSVPSTVTFYRKGNQKASGDGQYQDAPMPNQEMGRVLIEAVELQHG